MGFDRSESTFIFIFHSLYTCSVVKILPSPLVQTRVNLTTFLLTSRKDKVLCLLKIANPGSIWWLNMSILHNNQSFQLQQKVTFYPVTSCLLGACCRWVSCLQKDGVVGFFSFYIWPSWDGVWNWGGGARSGSRAWGEIRGVEKFLPYRHFWTWEVDVYISSFFCEAHL